MDAIDPRLRIGSVTLGVSDLERSTDFYQRVLGLPLQERADGKSILAGDGSPAALRLESIARPRPGPTGSAGLFHVAWLHRSRAGLAETVRRIIAEGRRIDGASDHGVSEALYLSDPDGLGIEIYADRPREQWRRPADGHGVEMVTLPLDLEDLLAQFDGQPGARIEAGTDVGHVHMKVADVARAAAFYAQALGFEEQARIPSAAFLSAGGYHHHIGLNSWHSRGGRPAPPDAPGLRRIDFELGDGRALAAVGQRAEAVDSLERSGDGELWLRDPDEELLRFTAAG